MIKSSGYQELKFEGNAYALRLCTFFLSTLICKACSELRLVSKSCVAKSVAAQIELDWRLGR
jgi:hypothetical protein